MKSRNLISSLLVVIAIATATPAAAAAVATHEFEEARTTYQLEHLAMIEQEQQRLLTALLMANGPYDTTGDEFAWAVERWRPVVAMYFPTDRVDWALHIIECESHGDPDAKNPRSTASGLFQHLASLWGERAAAAGWADADVFDPFANIAVAAWLLETGGPGHWVCKAAR
jgi:hypothetical protein